MSEDLSDVLERISNETPPYLAAMPPEALEAWSREIRAALLPIDIWYNQES